MKAFCSWHACSHIADLQGIHEVILRSGWFALKSLQQVKVFHTSCYRGNRGQKQNSDLSSLCRVTASTNLSTMSTRRTCCLNLFLHKSQNLSLGLSLSPRNCQKSMPREYQTLLWSATGKALPSSKGRPKVMQFFCAWVKRVAKKQSSERL